MSRNYQQVLKQTFRLFSPRGVEGRSGRSTSPDQLELDEPDVWSCCSLQPADARKPTVVGRSPQRKKIEAASSMPVNVPKILLHEYKSTDDDNYSSMSGRINNFEEEVEEEEEVSRLPPHEMARRGRAASLSVVEGAGRTLKGRDLSRVRNAIWAQTGFQD